LAQLVPNAVPGLCRRSAVCDDGFVRAGKALIRNRFRARLRNDLTQVFTALHRGDITPAIPAQLPLDRVAEALRLAESDTVSAARSSSSRDHAAPAPKPWTYHRAQETAR
jgi:hypothetical protein